ncbi:MAG: PilN domain-containing protein [Anaerohalosphaera sp.]|nr:PilN domain-containing protein [Anaerohalosphaera sp.]
MNNVDFVPEEYVNQRESNRANIVCLFLFVVIMGGIAATFCIIKVRQKAVEKDLAIVTKKMNDAKQQIAQLEQLNAERKVMMKTAVMTAELIETVPRSVLLACLTNNLPSSASLIELKIEGKDRTVVTSVPAKESKDKTKKAVVQTTTVTDTLIEIQGLATTDIDVANYIAALTNSILLEKVGLVESREFDIEGIKYRQFKLNAMLKKEIQLTKEDVERIRNKSKETI